MASFWPTLLFLVSYYWPFMAVAATIGLVTGWLSLSSEDRQ